MVTTLSHLSDKENGLMEIQKIVQGCRVRKQHNWDLNADSLTLQYFEARTLKFPHRIPHAWPGSSRSVY